MEWKRYISLWRVLLLGGAVLFTLSYFNLIDFDGEHIAQIEIKNIIYESASRHDLLRSLARKKNVRAVLVRIDSPGGSAGASAEIYHDLRLLSAEKPVVALMGTVAASGGYIVALGADHILARQTSLTGSIGAILQWFEFNELMQKIGVQPYSIRSGDLKAQPSPFDKSSAETKEHTQEIVQEIFDWFIELVAKRRNIDRDKLVKIAGDGRIFTGKKALNYQLIDDIGGEREALAWLAHHYDLSPNMKIKAYYPQDGSSDFLQYFFQSLASFLGFQLPVENQLPLSIGGVMLLWQF